MPSITLTPEKQVFVNQDVPTTNFDYDDKLVVGAPGGSICRSWLRYDLSPIPSGATINSASLSVYTFYGVGDNYSDFQIDVTRSTDITWDSGTINWNNAPSVGSVLSSITDSQFLTNYGNHPLWTGLETAVQAALASGKISLRLAADVGHIINPPDPFVYFANSDYPGVGLDRAPVLSVTYTESHSTGRPGIRTSGLMQGFGLLIGGGM